VQGRAPRSPIGLGSKLAGLVAALALCAGAAPAQDPTPPPAAAPAAKPEERLRTAEGAEVVVPNASLISDRLTNWTLNNSRRRVDLRLGVAYGTDPQKMLDLLLSVARSHREVLAYPPPSALFLGFGANTLDFELRCWTDDFDDWLEIRSQLALDLHRQLGDAGIETSSPQRVVQVTEEMATPVKR
jgi:small-conductance mechanosensitive channel